MTVFLPSDFNKDLHHLLYNLYILVSGFNHILKNMSSSMGFGLIIPYMMESQQNHVPVPNFRNPFFFPEGGSSPYFAEPGRPGRPGPTAKGEQRFQLSSPRLAQHGTGSIEQGVFAPWPAVEPLFMALGLPH